MKQAKCEGVNKRGWCRNRAVSLVEHDNRVFPMCARHTKHPKKHKILESDTLGYFYNEKEPGWYIGSYTREGYIGLSTYYKIGDQK